MKTENSASYSRLIGSIYVFNLIVGTGALALPKAFKDVGWLLGTIILTFLCILSFMTSTFMIEAMSISNGLLKLRKMKYAFTNAVDDDDDDDDDNNKNHSWPRALHTITEEDNRAEITKRNYGTVTEPIENDEQPESGGASADLIDQSNFEITNVFEMGKMAMTYFNRAGLVLFYLSICIYLYGDLAVYAATVPMSIRDVVCTYQINITKNETNSSMIHINESLGNSDPCWYGSDISRINVYRIFLAIFMLLLGPFVFFNVTKTKFLQISTLLMRWFAFGIMIVLMIVYLANPDYFKYRRPTTVANFVNSPNFIGVSVYSFMVHHSLPSLITPIRNKKRLLSILMFTMFLILLFYLLMSFLAIFTFIEIRALVTFNFEPVSNPGQPMITTVPFFQYYLSLFPVFSLSTSFPIIGVTLRNNLKNLITCGTGRQKFGHRYFDRMIYPLLTIVPPALIVFITDDIQLLVSITGSYAGSFIQYVFPALLVYYARRDLQHLCHKMRSEVTPTITNNGAAGSNGGSNSNNSSSTVDINAHLISDASSIDKFRSLHQSPFHSKFWIYGVLLWAALTIIFVSVQHIIQLAL